MAANDKFKEEDPEIINLFKQLEKLEKEEIKDKTSDFTNIKTIIDTLKNKYIEKIITFKIGYEKKDLEKNSITKLQEIYINYKEYKEYNDGNDKCILIRIIEKTINQKIKNKSLFLILFVAIFNKKNYILNKLFNEQYFKQSKTPTINNIIIKLNEFIKMFNIINNKEDTLSNQQDYNLFIDNTLQFCNLLLTQENNIYLYKIQKYIEFDNYETNFYYFLNLIQDKLIEFPKNICDTNSNKYNNKYNNKLFYNISYDEKELNIKALNTDTKLKLNVLLEDNTSEVIIKKIPLIFININKKYKANNPIKIFLNTIYQLYEDFIKFFDTIDIATINNKILLSNIDNIITYIKLLSKIFINNNREGNKVFFNDIYESIITKAADNITANKNDTLINSFTTYWFNFLEKMKSLLDDIDNRLICLVSVKEYLNSLNNDNLFKNIVSNVISETYNEYDKSNYIDNLKTFIGQLKKDNEEFKKYIDDVEKIIDDDISDGLNSFQQFTNDELEKLKLDIKPEKVSFGQTLEIGDNVLYLNSIVIKHQIGINYTNYIYACIYECSGKWYYFDTNSKPNFKALGNFAEMYKWIGPTDSTKTEEYVQKNVVGLFYT
jgi:hypothetical protein